MVIVVCRSLWHIFPKPPITLSGNISYAVVYGLWHIFPKPPITLISGYGVRSLWYIFPKPPIT